MSTSQVFYIFLFIQTKNLPKKLEIHLQPRISETECTVYQLIITGNETKRAAHYPGKKLFLRLLRNKSHGAPEWMIRNWER